MTVTIGRSRIFFVCVTSPPSTRIVFLCFVSGTRNYNFPHDVLYFSAPDLSPPFLSESNRLCGKPKTIRNILILGLRTGPGGARQDLWRQLSLHHQADTVHRQVRQELREALLNILNISNISNHDEAIKFVGYRIYLMRFDFLFPFLQPRHRKSTIS